MDQTVEIKYRKFPILFGQNLKDIPSFQYWQQTGWRVAWSYVNVEGGGRYVEALLKRSPSPHTAQAANQEPAI